MSKQLSWGKINGDTNDLQVPYDANVLSHSKRKHTSLQTIIAIGKWGFYRHVASVKSSLSNIVHDTHDSHVKRPFVLRSPLYHLNMILALLSTTGATTGKHARARTQNTYGQLWLRLKRITDLITTSIVNRPLFPRNSRQLK